MKGLKRDKRMLNYCRVLGFMYSTFSYKPTSHNKKKMTTLKKQPVITSDVEYEMRHNNSINPKVSGKPNPHSDAATK